MTFLEDLPKTCPMCFNDFNINKDGSGIGEIKCVNKDHRIYFEFFESNNEIFSYQIFWMEKQSHLLSSQITRSNYYEIIGFNTTDEEQIRVAFPGGHFYFRGYIIPEKFSKEEIKEFIIKLNMLKTFL
jgi:hypothetical protein